MLYYKNCYRNLYRLNLKQATIKLLTKHQQQLLFKSTTTAATTTNIENSECDDAAKREWENAKPFEDIPTMTTFNMLKHFLPGGKYSKLDSTQLMLAFKEDLGSISYLPGMFGRPGNIITHNVQDFEKVLRNEGIWPSRPALEGLNYHRSVHRADFFQGNEGILATHGEQWGSFRSTVNPILMQTKNVRMYLLKMSQVNKEFTERIRQIRDPKSLEVPNSFEEEINRWTLESVSVVALDKKLGLINENRNDPLAKKMFDTLNEFLDCSLEIEIKPSIWRYYHTATFKKLMQCLDTIMEITSNYINEAIERIEKERNSGKIEKPESEKSVLEKLIKIDRKIAIVMAMDLLMAGVDTTSSTFTGLLLSLAKNPEKQQKLREEVMKILPQKDSEFNESSMKNMSYLRACIKESMRVYPLTVGNSRIPVKDIVLSGYRVPKGTRVTMISTSMLRDDKHYPRANEYLPERWLRPSPDTENTPECPLSLRASSPFIYLPFGFGPRSCIGRRIVEMELELGIARLVRNFNIEFNYPTENAFKSLLFNVPNIPLTFKFADIEN